MNSKIAKYVGTQVRGRRKKANITQEELGDIVNLSRVSIVNMEAGNQTPTLETLLLLCAIFNCSVSDLLPKPPKAIVTKRFKINWK